MSNEIITTMRKRIPVQQIVDIDVYMKVYGYKSSHVNDDVKIISAL